MRKVLLLSVVCIFIGVSLSAQNNALTYRNGVWQNGIRLSSSDVKALMVNDPEALSVYKKGQGLVVAGYIIGIPCAAAFGFDLGTRMGGGKGNATVLAAGAVGTVVSLIMSLVGENNVKQSVQLYNSKLGGETSYRIDFGLNRTGIGLSLTF